ncbi:hypothetical protein EYF80_065532 [Liparis tanakae]|uniref:Uncharacterized protein n=1 Tax=Liparis tanakae TaxID=230148 RepID=A0A4Z2E6Z2_9TELE|nr:hypothetical protein EYF80_065532 [Liparis tanakae]
MFRPVWAAVKLELSVFAAQTETRLLHVLQNILQNILQNTSSWSPLRTTKRFLQISLKIPFPQNFRIQPTLSGGTCCGAESDAPWTGNRKQEAVRSAVRA